MPSEQNFWNPKAISCLNTVKYIINKIRQILEREEDICKDKFHGSMWSGIYKELYELIREY